MLVTFTVLVLTGTASSANAQEPSRNTTVQQPSPAEPLSASTGTDDDNGTLSPLNAIRAYQGLVVHDITFEGIEQNDDARLRKLIPQKVNQPLDPAKIRSSVLALYTTGRFADLQVSASRTPQNEVSLVFRGAENYFVGMVTVEGTPKELTPAQLANASKLQLGELFTREKLQQGIARMSQLLEQNGYYRATI